MVICFSLPLLEADIDQSARAELMEDICDIVLDHRKIAEATLRDDQIELKNCHHEFDLKIADFLKRRELRGWQLGAREEYRRILNGGSLGLAILGTEIMGELENSLPRSDAYSSLDIEFSVLINRAASGIAELPNDNLADALIASIKSAHDSFQKKYHHNITNALGKKVSVRLEKILTLLRRNEIEINNFIGRNLLN